MDKSITKDEDASGVVAKQASIIGKRKKVVHRKSSRLFAWVTSFGFLITMY